MNNLLKKFVKRESEKTKNIQIIHQTGLIDKTDWESFYKKYDIPAFHFSYYENIKDLYLLSDLVVSRGGAGTLFELEFFKKQSIIIPIKSHASGHQTDNAQAMAKRNPDLFTLLDQDIIDKDFDLFEDKL